MLMKFNLKCIALSELSDLRENSNNAMDYHNRPQLRILNATHGVFGTKLKRISNDIVIVLQKYLYSYGLANHYGLKAQSSKICKKVQFWEDALFASKTKINIYGFF